jgi:hypothetical protein
MREISVPACFESLDATDRRNVMKHFCVLSLAITCAMLVLTSALASGQSASLQVSTCDPEFETTPPPACSAVLGDRADGWLTQTRSEVMGRNGMTFW